MGLHCPACDFDNPPGMRFCGNCGARLSSPEPQTLARKPALKSAPASRNDLGPPHLSPEPVVATETSSFELAPSPGEFSPEQIGVLVGGDLLERFRQAGLEATGQRRHVTILFADLAGYTEISERLDSEDIYELIQDFIRLLAEEVYKYEGIVDKYTGDGLMAIFGAPITHENNAERAVRAAMGMQAAIQGLGQEVRARLDVELRLRLGLNAGPVIVGGVGSDYLMNYTAIGDTVNLANRLEQAASPGTILASESVYQQTRMLFDFQQLPNLHLKGLANPVTGYQFIGQKARPGSVRGIEGLHAPMVGRQEELGRLNDAVRTLAQRRQGSFALITGEAGLGKSRLTSELKTLVKGVPIQVLEGHSLAYRRSVSYWIFLDLLRSYLGARSDTPEEDVSRRLTHHANQVLGPRSADLLPYLEHLLSLKPSNPLASSRIAYLDASQLRQQIFLAVRDLLAAEARRRPLLLILEDLHWADDASLDLLQFLLEAGFSGGPSRQVPMMILSISRPFQDGPLARITAWAEKSLGDRFIPLRLRSLSPDQSEDLLSELLSLPDLPPTQRQHILERAAGVPFYLEEILRMLIDRGLLRQESGRWRVDPAAASEDAGSLDVPDTLQGLILARFDRLDKPSRRLLQVASVIGNHFSLPLLKTAQERAFHPEGSRGTAPERAGLGSILDHLVARDFLTPLTESTAEEPASGGQTVSIYAFRHVLMAEAIYSTLLKRERRKLHGRVGEAIEALFADRLDEQVEILARHYSWSDRPDRALRYLILAGQKNTRSYANQQARQHFTAALGLLTEVEHTPGQSQQVHLGLGDVLSLAGEYQEARKQYEAAEQSILSEAPAHSIRDLGGVLRKIATTFERQGEYDQAMIYLSESQQVLADSPLSLPVECAQAMNEIGWIEFRRGNLEPAEETLTRALALAESRSQYDLTASIYNRLGGIYFQKGQLEQASRYVRKSLVLREEIGDIVAVARSYNNLGLLGWKRGDWESALANFQHSMELHANLGDVEGMMEVHSNLGLLHIDRGEPEQAEEHLHAALCAAQQIGHAYGIGITTLHLSHLSVSTGDWQTALDYGSRSLGIIQEIGDRDYLVDVYINIGLAWLGQGDLDQAQEWGRRALECFEGVEQDRAAALAENRGRALRLLGEAARRRRDYAGADQLLRDSASIFQASGSQLEQARSSLALARLAAGQGEMASARILMNEARLIFMQLGAKLDLRKIEEFVEEIGGK